MAKQVISDTVITPEEIHVGLRFMHKYRDKVFTVTRIIPCFGKERVEYTGEDGVFYETRDGLPFYVKDVIRE